ncbi:hypothetical protein HNV11_22880 [Spirosoma taeanense]|uniref:Uncharacterized protein n=1 Tax=Spirosoma taeanense TaxID=2735870 RepID=A0A6M5YFH9_9BACT|nr:hypothetical protein [Spirosoma taeanense]QJW92023.1 hypothetical protein HNV11_22880 [Spirosoma taeanense]
MSSTFLAKCAPLLQIAQVMPVDGTVQIASFTDPLKALQCLQQQGISGREVRIMTNDAAMYWVVPRRFAYRLMQIGFYPLKISTISKSTN